MGLMYRLCRMAWDSRQARRMRTAWKMEGNQRGEVGREGG